MFLGLGTEQIKRRCPKRYARREGNRHGCVDAREFHHGQRVADGIGPRPAVFFRERKTEESKPRHLRHDFVREGGFAVECFGLRSYHFAREFAAKLLDRLLIT